MRIIIVGSIALAVLLINGCAIAPPQQEIALPDQSIAAPVDEMSRSKVVIFNASNPVLFGIDGSGVINIHIDGKGVGQLAIGKYVVVQLDKGVHKLELAHRDVGIMASSHEIHLTDSIQYLKIYAKVSSNGAEVVNKPEKFESKFTAAYSR
jgi:hypothetical protein